MSKMAKCKTCGHDISKKAKTCPSCGEKNPAKKTSAGGVLLLILLGLFIIGSLNSPSGQNSNASSNTPASASNLPELALISWRCTEEYGYIGVEGEVKNISSKKMDNVTAIGSFRTKSGELVKSSDALIEYNPIMPGQTSPFKTMTTTNPEIKGCGVSFKYLMGGAIQVQGKQ